MKHRLESALTVYQAKFQTYLLWSQPFLYRLFESLQPKAKQIVLTQRVEHADLFPLPIIERLNSRIFYSPYHAHVAACRLQQRYRGDLIHAHFGFTAYKLMLLKHFMRLPMAKTGEMLWGKPMMRAGHTVLLVGLDDETETATALNSFGPQWGQHGFFKMPYKYLLSKKCYDFWVLRHESE